MFQAQHNCRTCPNFTCGLRHVEPLQIRMFTEEKEVAEEIIYREGSLLEALRNQTEGIPAFCGGKGLCGKCKIQVVEGWLSITEEDRRFFGEEELKQGWRLACRAYPKENLTIRAGWKNESQMEVLSGYYKAGEERKKSQKPAGEEKGFAIDIGVDHGGCGTGRPDNRAGGRYLHLFKRAADIRSRCNRQNPGFYGWKRQPNEGKDTAGIVEVYGKFASKKKSFLGADRENNGCRKYHHDSFADGISLRRSGGACHSPPITYRK